MLTLSSDHGYRECDGLTRRNFLQVGALGGLSLPALLAARSAQAATGKPVRDTSVVWLWLQGGASQLETFDPKLSVPREYRSTGGEVATTLPGVMIGGHFVETAKRVGKVAIIRSFTHTSINHIAATHFVMTGYDNGTVDNAFGPQTRPSMGAIASYVRGPLHADTQVPTYVSVIPEGKRTIEYEGPSFLGEANRPFHPFVESYGSMKLRVSGDRLADRRSLLRKLDNLRRETDARGTLGAVDSFQSQAIDLILGRARDAFDLEQEDPKLVERYGQGLGARMLLARRVAEAGCGFVTVKHGTWDFHGESNNGPIKDGMDRLCPGLDQVLSTFIDDLYARGLQEKILLVVTGDFGRTPKINHEGGRDHWPQLSTLAFIGGGLKTGQVIGRSDAKGAFPMTNAYGPPDLMATIFHVLGIDRDTQAANFAGRPVYLLESGRVIPELI